MAGNQQSKYRGKISDKYQTDSIKIEFYLFQNKYI